MYTEIDKNGKILIVNNTQKEFYEMIFKLKVNLNSFDTETANALSDLLTECTKIKESRVETVISDERIVPYYEILFYCIHKDNADIHNSIDNSLVNEVIRNQSNYIRTLEQTLSYINNDTEYTENEYDEESGEMDYSIIRKTQEEDIKVQSISDNSEINRLQRLL